MERYLINKYLLSFKEKLESLKESIKLESLEKEIANLSEKTNSEDFWNNQKESKEVFNKLNNLKDRLKGYKDLYARYEDLVVLDEMSSVDESLNSELEETINAFNSDLEEYEIQILLTVS